VKLSIGQLADELGVTTHTIREWCKEGKITYERTKGGHRRFDLDTVLSSIGSRKPKKEKLTIGYARVSTADAKNDLANQIKAIELFCSAKGWNHKIISDVGSGLNYNKKGLKELINLIETNQIQRVVLNYKDRLLRFGSEIIFEMCSYHNTEVVIINETENKTYNEELVEDVVSIITVFSSILYGSRSHKNTEIVKKSKEMFKLRETVGQTNKKNS
jgi:excisionase family DNA binding protein